MYLFIPFIWILINHVYKIMSMDCEYSSREYQVFLRPDLMINSFETGVMQVIDELVKIEDLKMIPFKVLQSSLKFKNVSFTQYVSDNNRPENDFYIRPVFKSRQKKITAPADIVMKISNIDPALACLQLKIAEDYLNSTVVKFELDIHTDNGKLTVKSAHSFTTSLSFDFDQISPVNLSSILINAGTVTRSGQPIIIVPDSLGKVTMQTAEFTISLAGKKFEAEIMHYPRIDDVKAEFSFKVKSTKVDSEVLRVAQQLVAYLSQLRTIALYAFIHSKDQ
ncbi:unnamed protein product [Rotaria sordida]|uniref:Uncharacterized protein n=1 Tax=Rotaria sordida TaxID=392033 RepID=A0A814UA15_9BILA|nr:unnamed protein product [Rotaria sordida]CAF1103823.1 unnamed protein product [Rotaria sordida]CAF1171601.1 unnamed protein product [Rotaria sordida]CAF3783181.1 unnamed protein product [Rotaria sordida]